MGRFNHVAKIRISWFAGISSLQNVVVPASPLTCFYSFYNKLIPKFTYIFYSKMANTCKPKVLVTRRDIPQEAFEKLTKSCDVEIYPQDFPIPRDVLLKKIKGIDGLFCLITEKIDCELLDAAGSNLKVIGTMSVGHDHIDLNAVKSRGIKVGYTPGVLTDATAELTIALLLATSRRLFESHRELLNGGWSKCAWSPLWMTGSGLSNSTVGIFGFGRIGQAVVKRLKGFNIKKVLYNSRAKKEEGNELSAEYVSFNELLERSDFIIITAALNEQTKGIFDKRAFKLMKKSAILVNTSRGGLVNQDDLIEALKFGEIRAAGLDVMTPEPLPVDDPLILTPNITLIPHIGSAEINTRTAMATLTADNIIAAFEGKQMPQQLC